MHRFRTTSQRLRLRLGQLPQSARDCRPNGKPARWSGVPWEIMGPLIKKSSVFAASTLPLAIGLIATTATQGAFAEILKADSLVVDEVQVARIKKAWDETREYYVRRAKGEAADSDDPERRYAPQFFQYWINHKRTNTGRQAIESAFMMWGNTGDVVAVQRAVKRIELDSPVWRRVIGGISNAYVAQGQVEQFVSWLDPVASRLADRPSLSRAYAVLGLVLEKAGEQKRARGYYEKVVDLGADASDAKVAQSALQEMDLLQVGQPVTDFTAEDIDGSVVQLTALKGRVVLLEFWATWCEPCLKEVEPLRKIFSASDPGQLVVVQVSRDYAIEALRKFVKDRELFWHQIWDGFDGKLAAQFNATGIPRSYLIDREGHIAAKDLRGDQLQSAVASLITSPPY